jgi:hypothetical protein
MFAVSTKEKNSYLNRCGKSIRQNLLPFTTKTQHTRNNSNTLTKSMYKSTKTLQLTSNRMVKD